MTDVPQPAIRPKRLLFIVAALIGMAIGVAWHYGVFDGLAQSRPPANSLMVIQPYRHAGTWVFDDAAASLDKEPFVAGVPEMIDLLVADIPNADDGFRMIFSAKEFPGYQKKLTWDRGEKGGNYYRLDDPPMEGWLCPALFKYFKEAPKELYVKAEPK